MSRTVKTTNAVLRTLGVVGSLFVRKTIEGKYEVAIAPALITLALGGTVTCAVQENEPFRQCVKSTITMLQEVAHAS